MKQRPDEVLNECVFDKTIEYDMATVSVNVAEEAIRRYAKQEIDHIEEENKALKDVLKQAIALINTADKILNND